MKSRIIFYFVVLVLLAMLSGCVNTSHSVELLDDIEELSAQLSGITQKEVHKLLGSPAGTLSGFWGDTYYNSDEQMVIIYYDADGKVELVKMADVSPER